MADWCGPCKAIAPVIKDIAREYSREIAVYEFDIDANPATKKRFAVQGIPTLMLFRAGAGTRIAGPHTRSNLSAVIDAALEDS